jgi:AcrR family transcriptional regulator
MSEQTLRDQQTGLTRDLILEALTRLVSEEGVHDFSIQRVAELAGVSHRTVYRHFASREELLEALAVSLESRMPRELSSYEPCEIGAAIHDVHAVFAKDPERVKALAVLAAGARIRLPHRRKNTRAVERALASIASHLSPEDAEAVAVLIRSIAGSLMWFQFTDEHGLDPERTTRVVVWAVEVLVDSLKAGNGPGGEKRLAEEH